ncbi:ROK family protein [Aerococcaceae bacterium zg-BR22]|uniref:ROK family protein n=1 Tax=Aerococcaceae bacterium zg-1292 TaxID=2774330 RepID=UPI00406428D1|nr:ROK family protein [Aerococcaceae bacterium zg-BR22]
MIYLRILCFDFGGTSVKYGVWNGKELEGINLFSTPSSWPQMKKKLKGIFDKFDNINGIGISAPGSVDSKNGVIRGISAIPYIHNFEIIKELEQLFNRKVLIENDANSAALAELYYGGASKLSNVAFFIIGSGIGGAISIDRKVIKGANLFGGEIGYMLLNENDTVSKLASPVQVAHRFAGLSGIQLFELASNGNSEAQKAVEGIIDALARSMYNVCLLLDPEKILIGGAISQRDDFILPIQNKLEYYLEKMGAGDLSIKIEKCHFKESANLVGAAVNYENSFGKGADIN